MTAELSLKTRICPLETISKPDHVDYHSSFQQTAFFIEETGECGEQLNHSDGEAERFYLDLKQRGICVRVGMEARGYPHQICRHGVRDAKYFCQRVAIYLCWFTLPSGITVGGADGGG
jgi:hypothetical protein